MLQTHIVCNWAPILGKPLTNIRAGAHSRQRAAL